MSMCTYVGRMYACTCALCMHVHVLCACMYVCMCPCTPVRVCMFVCTYVHMYACIHVFFPLKNFFHYVAIEVYSTKSRGVVHNNDEALVET
jgi:hypothetical protein